MERIWVLKVSGAVNAVGKTVSKVADVDRDALHDFGEGVQDFYQEHKTAMKDIGAIGGFIVGIGAYALTDGIQINGKSIRDNIKDGISDFFGW